MQYKHNYHFIVSVIVIILFIAGSSLHSQVNKRDFVPLSTQPSKKYDEQKIQQHPLPDDKMMDIEQSSIHPGNSENILSITPKRIVRQAARHMLKSTSFAIDTAYVYTAANTLRYTYTFDGSGNRVSELEQKWTNGQWVDSYLSTHTYDASGNELSCLSERWTDGQRVNSGRWSYTYDASGNRLSYLLERWTDNQWMNYSRDTYTYDSSGYILTYFHENWTDGQWVSVFRSTYTNDVSGNILTYLDENWILNEFYRDTYTYNASGHELSQLEETWTNGKWINSFRDAHMYDSSGKEVSYLYEQWSNEQWANYVRSTPEYDSSGNEVSRLTEQWMNEQWVKTYCDTYTYDENGNRLSYISETWTDTQWVNYYRYTYTYDASGNELSSVYEKWTDRQWVNDYRHGYSYDASGNTTLIISERWNISQWVPKSNFINISDSAGYNYSFYGYKISLHYRQITTGVAFERTAFPYSYNLLQNFPNPFNPSTMISFSLPSRTFVSLKVFDLIGREVATIVNEELAAGNHKRQWSAANVSTGVYFYRLRAGSFADTRRMVFLR